MSGMTNGDRAARRYLATEPASPEYALVRVVAFGVIAVSLLVASILVDEGFSVLSIFCVVALGVWTRRWRQAVRAERAAGT